MSGSGGAYVARGRCGSCGAGAARAATAVDGASTGHVARKQCRRTEGVGIEIGKRKFCAVEAGVADRIRLGREEKNGGYYGRFIFSPPGNAVLKNSSQK